MPRPTTFALAAFLFAAVAASQPAGALTPDPRSADRTYAGCWTEVWRQGDVIGARRRCGTFRQRDRVQLCPPSGQPASKLGICRKSA